MSDPLQPLTLQAFKAPLEAPPEVSAYTPDVQRRLLSVWISALLTGIRSLPMLICRGDKGGGKTAIVRAMLHMLLGKHADLPQLTDDKRDLYTMLCTSLRIGLANMDSAQERWVPDLLAATVTGGHYRARKLFTDGQEIERAYDAALAVSTRTATFANRSDARERVLPIFTGSFRKGDRRPDTTIMAEVTDHRDGLMTWATMCAASALAWRDKAPNALPGRFIGYAAMVWGYMAMGGFVNLAEPMLKAWHHATSVAVGERDELVDAILAYGDGICTNGEWYGTPAELIKGLGQRVERPYMGGGRAISRRLREAQSTLGLMGWTLVWARSGNNTKYNLRHNKVAQPSLDDALDEMVDALAALEQGAQ